MHPGFALSTPSPASLARNARSSVVRGASTTAARCSGDRTAAPGHRSEAAVEACAAPSIFATWCTVKRGCIMHDLLEDAPSSTANEMGAEVRGGPQKT